MGGPLQPKAANDVQLSHKRRERDKRTMLTAFFETNKFNVYARQYLYKDFPKRFTWNKTTRRWNPRKRGSIRGRLGSANTAEGERFYLWLLLTHVCGPTDWKDLYTVNNVLYQTFRRAALERNNNNDKLYDMSLASRGDDKKLWDDHYESLLEDYRRVYENVERDAYDEILRHVDNDISGMFFIDGPGGTRKTFLYKALLAKVRSRGLIAIATASSGAAANNMPGGRTAHSRFKIHINLDNNSLCNIKKQSRTAKLLRSTKLIIWDEALKAKQEGCRGTRSINARHHGDETPFRWKNNGLRRLTFNMRARTDPWFSDFLLRVGNVDEEVVDKNYIRIPDDMTIPYNDMARSKE
ncbi:ATP-dependent DNA helicase PIF1-like protein [Tanacetum coccineum]